jgi:hypothetical protein
LVIKTDTAYSSSEPLSRRELRVAQEASRACARPAARESGERQRGLFTCGDVEPERSLGEPHDVSATIAGVIATLTRDINLKLTRVDGG